MRAACRIRRRSMEPTGECPVIARNTRWKVLSLSGESGRMPGMKLPDPPAPAFRIHATDNVAVVLEAVKAGRDTPYA